jgi:hypothetical protein
VQGGPKESRAAICFDKGSWKKVRAGANFLKMMTDEARSRAAVRPAVCAVRRYCPNPPCYALPCTRSAALHGFMILSR